MSDFGPERGTPKWQEQVERMVKCLSYAESKKEMETVSMAYILDRSYSRSAITQALHDVEIKKGWHQ